DAERQALPCRLSLWRGSERCGLGHMACRPQGWNWTGQAEPRLRLLDRLHALLPEAGSEVELSELHAGRDGGAAEGHGVAAGDAVADQSGPVCLPPAWRQAAGL